MRIAVYATFVVDAVLVLAALAATSHVHPCLATKLLTAVTLVVAVSSVVALTVLAAGAFGGLVVAADMNRWPTSVALPTPVSGGVEVAAAAALVLTALRLAAGVRRMVRVAKERRTLGRAAGPTELAVIDLPNAVAFALPGRPGRIVVSPSMLRALDAQDRRALLAHERAHLRQHHHLYQAAANLGAALNPMLIPVRHRVRFCIERWADEQSAQELGERRTIARALARAGLAAAGHTGPLAAFATTSVPARVEALLQGPPTTSRWRLLWLAVLASGAIVLAAEAAHDLERVFELAVRFTR